MESALEVKKINKSYMSRNRKVHAVKNVSFEIYEGECVGLVGESGCGKSTIAKIISHLESVDSGEIFLNGKDITDASGKTLREIYKSIQMVFQNPVDSFNPRLKLGESIMEGMINHGVSRGIAKVKAGEYLKLCGLPKEFADRYPHQVSGGECQRASIARAIAIEPRLLICDEVTSALDVTVQEQIVKLMKELKEEMKMAYLFICHDIALVQEVCDRVLVMYKGQVIEEGSPDEIIKNPQNEYTKRLIDSVFEIPW
ncbi:MAG: ABC transporter ATP-binding protein [Thermotaleaceae bacterium]